jgi:hypothetical protein
MAWALLIVTAPGLIVNSAMAANLTWDNAKDGGAGSDGPGTWLDANQWTDLTNQQTWSNSNPDNAIIGVGGTGGTITLGTVTAGSVRINPVVTTGYTLSGGSLSLGSGLTVNGTTATAISTPVTVSAPQTFAFNSASAATLSGGLTLNADLTVAGSGHARLPRRQRQGGGLGGLAAASPRKRITVAPDRRQRSARRLREGGTGRFAGFTVIAGMAVRSTI